MSENAHIALTISQSEFSAMLQQADVLIKSGFLPQHIRTPAQAVAIMTMARELRIGIWAAFNGVSVINGQPTISPQLMLALIYASGQLESIEIDDPETIARANACRVTMKRRGLPPHTESFTIQMATAMGLTSKQNWRQQPAVMLKWRAVAACARVVFPDVIKGFYTPEEIAPERIVVDTETGEIISVSPDPRELNATDDSWGDEQSDDENMMTELINQRLQQFDEMYGGPRIEAATQSEDNGQAASSDHAEQDDLADLLDRRLSELDGRGLYRVQEAAPRMLGLHPKHFRNRLKNRFRDVRSLRDIELTVRDWLDAMSTQTLPGLDDAEDSREDDNHAN